MDEDFSTRIRSRSPQVAYLEAMSEEGRLLRPDHTPLVDKSWIATYLRKEPKSVFEPKGGYVAESGDIAYVYGEVENKAHLGVYMRVWRHEARDGWKLALEVIQYSADK
jgi:ketosteroid isomerase-like protein